MRFTTLMMIVLLVISSVVFTACGDDDNDNDNGTIITDPFDSITQNNTDWMVFFWAWENLGKADLTTYAVSCRWLGEQTVLTEDDVMALQIDGSVYLLESSYDYDDGNWSFSAEFEFMPGQLYSMALLKNGSQVAATEIRIPYFCEVDFPEEFDPTQTYEFAWTREGVNHYQAFSAESEALGQDHYSEFETFLEPSANSFTMNANTLESYGENTHYRIVLTQLNLVREGRILFAAEDFQAKYYNGTLGKDEALARHHDQIIKLILAK